MTIVSLSEFGETAQPIEMKVQIIQPGWGNQVDNHYYPEAVIKRDAGKFKGAKMYETDHRDEEKSTRTWVSTITEIDGFTETGAPVAKVVIHDPGFGERVKNLNKAGLLQKMECSIYASGTAVSGYEEGGRKGKQITAITEVISVDWVTRAGAGGRALELTENSKDGGNMNEPEKIETPVETQETEVSPVQAVSITEADNNDAGISETAETTPEVLPAVALSGEAVIGLLTEAKLPEPAVARLAKRVYMAEAEVLDAVAEEKQYLESVTGAGKPVGLGESNKLISRIDVAERVAAAADSVNAKYFGKLK